MEITKSDILQATELVGRVEKEIGRHIVGQAELVRNVLISIIAGGNVLLEGLPGLGKTRLVKTIGGVLDLEFSRIQFTPDLMPADILGTNIVNKRADGGSEFIFQKGPVFANIVLADEINRATPKTQSATLEAMQEHTVTVGNNTYKLPQPFFVMATQNPIEMEGTYPLPEAQMDRFLFKLNVQYPSLKELKDIVNLTAGGREEQAEKAADTESLLKVRSICSNIPVADPVMEYAVKMVMATHPGSGHAPSGADKYVRFGASPRGAQALVAASRILAVLEGRLNVSYDDIRTMAFPCLRHRLFINFEGVSQGLDADDIIKEIIEHLNSK